MARGPLILAEERSKMLRLELAGVSRSQIARECKRSKSLVTRTLGVKFKNKGRGKLAVKAEATASPVGFQKGNKLQEPYLDTRMKFANAAKAARREGMEPSRLEVEDEEPITTNEAQRPTE